jgi:hypothetical protein
MPFVVKQEHFRIIQVQWGAFSHRYTNVILYIFQNVTVLPENVTVSVTFFPFYTNDLIGCKMKP